jgi:hypothetical protein
MNLLFQIQHRAFNFVELFGAPPNIFNWELNGNKWLFQVRNDGSLLNQCDCDPALTVTARNLTRRLWRSKHQCLRSGLPSATSPLTIRTATGVDRSAIRQLRSKQFQKGMIWNDTAAYIWSDVTPYGHAEIQAVTNSCPLPHLEPWCSLRRANNKYISQADIRLISLENASDLYHLSS